MPSLKCSPDLENLIKKIVLDTYFPIGSIYLSTSTDNPGSRFGGTWELQGKDCYLIGYDSGNAWFDTPGASTGSNGNSGNWNTNDTALTVDQLPKHTHGSKSLTGYVYFRDVNTTDNNIIVGRSGILGFDNSTTWSGSHWAMSGATKSSYKYNKMTVDASHEHTNVGNNQGHKHFHVSPYYVVCVWRRIG